MSESLNKDYLKETALATVDNAVNIFEQLLERFFF